MKYAKFIPQEEVAFVVGECHNGRATGSDHEVRESQTQDDDIHGVEDVRVLQHDGYHQGIVEDRQKGVDEHEEGQNAVPHPGEDRGWLWSLGP